jgi:hypothetical protein
MKNLLFVGILLCWFGAIMHITSAHELCPFVCREAQGEWYETQLPTFGYSHVLWMSEKQKEYRRRAIELNQEAALPLLPWVRG